MFKCYEKHQVEISYLFYETATTVVCWVLSRRVSGMTTRLSCQGFVSLIFYVTTKTTTMRLEIIFQALFCSLVDFTLAMGLLDEFLNSFAYCGYVCLLFLDLDHPFNYIMIIFLPFHSKSTMQLVNFLVFI